MCKALLLGDRRYFTKLYVTTICNKFLEKDYCKSHSLLLFTCDVTCDMIVLELFHYKLQKQFKEIKKAYDKVIEDINNVIDYISTASKVVSALDNN